MFMPIDALSVLCAQLTHDLFAIAKFLLMMTADEAVCHLTKPQRTAEHSTQHAQLQFPVALRCVQLN